MLHQAQTGLTGFLLTSDVAGIQKAKVLVTTYRLLQHYYYYYSTFDFRLNVSITEALTKAPAII